MIEIRKRFGYYNLAESLEEASSSTSQLVDLPSSGSQEKFGEFNDAVEARLGIDSESYSVTRVAEKIQHFEGLLSTTPPGTDRHNECLRSLAVWYTSKSIHTKDLLYRISMNPSSIIGCHSMQLIPETCGDIIPFHPCAKSSTLRSKKSGRSTTSTRRSPSAMTFRVDSEDITAQPVSSCLGEFWVKFATNSYD